MRYRCVTDATWLPPHLAAILINDRYSIDCVSDAAHTDNDLNRSDRTTLVIIQGIRTQLLLSFKIKHKK